MELVFVVVVLAVLYFYFSSKSKAKKTAQRTEGRSSATQRNNSSKTKGKRSDTNPMDGFVVFDVETTGLNASRNKIIEIAAIKVTDLTSNEHATLEYLIKIDSRVPEKIVQITGITDQMLKDGVDLNTAMQGFKEFCGKLPLVAYNAEFDKAFLSRAAQEIQWTIENEFHCALQMAKLAFPGHNSYRLSELANHAGIETKGAHRALADCVMASQVYSAAYKKLGYVVSV